MDRDLLQEATPADATPAAALDPAGVDALVETLRTARLTVLIGAAGSGKSRLLREAVRPLLHRRADDACTLPVPAAEAGGPGGVDLLERRRRRVRPRELVVWCDRWDGSPVERLHAGLDEATGVGTADVGLSRAPLALRVEALGRERGARLLFVLDHGDRVAPAEGDGAGPAAEYEALVTTLCGIGPSVHVLVSARDDALPPPVRSRLDRPDTRVLRLPDRRRADARAAAAPIAAPVETAWAPPSGSDERPLQRDEVYESIITRLAAIGAGKREPPWGSEGAVATAAAVPVGIDAAPGPSIDDPRRLAGERQRGGAVGLLAWPLSRAGVAGVALLASAVVGVLLWQDRSPTATRPEPSMRTIAGGRYGGTPADLARAAAAGRPVTSDAATERVDAPLADAALAESGSDALIAAQFWREMAAQGSAVGGDDAVHAVSAAQPLAIVAYDTLRALAAAPGTAKTTRVVAPLYTEEVQVLVRADSPLNFVHEIGGRRINVGAAQSRRGLTAAAVYRQLFEAPLPAGKTDTAALDRALAELLDARSLDAIFLVEPQPSAWLAGLSEAQRRGLKALRLAPDEASTRRALRAYLPATLHTALGGASADMPALGVMTFLVAHTAPATGRRPVAASAAQALCQALPDLRRNGHPAWRAVDPALRLPLPLPYDDDAAAVLENCEANRSAAAPRPSISLSQADSNSREGEHE